MYRVYLYAVQYKVYVVVFLDFLVFLVHLVQSCTCRFGCIPDGNYTKLLQDVVVYASIHYTKLLVEYRKLSCIPCTPDIGFFLDMVPVDPLYIYTKYDM